MCVPPVGFFRLAGEREGSVSSTNYRELKLQVYGAEVTEL
jgi:hypothetical protein